MTINIVPIGKWTRKIIHRLTHTPQPDQRTDEWYNMRNQLITASNIWKVFGTESSRNQLIYEKCSVPVNFSSCGRVNTSSPMHYGVKYEPVSTAIYEHMFDTTVGEFGCIRHERYDFIGASPDGINVDEEVGIIR